MYWISLLTYLPSIDGYPQLQTLELRNQATVNSFQLTWQ
jgi:hypothetical protein